MFFYRIGAWGHEESYSMTYVSVKEYSQEEFEDIVFDVYEKYCYQCLDDNPLSPCFPNIYFSVEDSVFSKEYNQIMEKEYDLYSLTKKLNGTVSFDLTCNDNPKPYTDRLESIRDNLSFDMTCKDNDCSRICDLDKCERDRTRKYCLVETILHTKDKHKGT